MGGEEGGGLPPARFSAEPDVSTSVRDYSSLWTGLKARIRWESGAGGARTHDPGI